MGTDIHCWVEKRVDGKWELVPARKGEPGFCEYWNGPSGADDYSADEQALLKGQWDIDRDYDAFAILADVRNGFGFAGCDLGDGFKPILGDTEETPDHRRGWPEDACALLKHESIDHSPSWLTLRELNDYDWKHQVATKRGVVPLPVYAAWRDTASPRKAPARYCGGVSGRDCETLTMQRADDLMRIGERTTAGWTEGPHFWDPPPGHPKTYVTAQWEETYDVAAGDFYAKHLPALNEVAKREGVSPDDLRIVFYFDS